MRAISVYVHTQPPLTPTAACAGKLGRKCAARRPAVERGGPHASLCRACMRGRGAPSSPRSGRPSAKALRGPPPMLGRTRCTCARRARHVVRRQASLTLSDSSDCERRIGALPRRPRRNGFSYGRSVVVADNRVVHVSRRCWAWCSASKRVSVESRVDSRIVPGAWHLDDDVLWRRRRLLGALKGGSRGRNTQVSEHDDRCMAALDRNAQDWHAQERKSPRRRERTLTHNAPACSCHNQKAHSATPLPLLPPRGYARTRRCARMQHRGVRQVTDTPHGAARPAAAPARDGAGVLLATRPWPCRPGQDSPGVAPALAEPFFCRVPARPCIRCLRGRIARLDQSANIGSTPTLAVDGRQWRGGRLGAEVGQVVVSSIAKAEQALVVVHGGRPWAGSGRPE